MHTLGTMIDRIRAFIVVVEEGSINRAALRLRISQPALSRQMQGLEELVGGRLLEREAAGVTPTALGHAFVKALGPLAASCEEVIADLRRQARGERSELRIGYLVSAASSVLTPALASLKLTCPGVKVRLHDMSPREQIDALRRGELDVALIGQEGAVAAREFLVTVLARLGVCAALPDDDPLAGKEGLFLANLRGRDFVGVDDTEVPGRNRWMTGLCRRAGFRPRFPLVVDGITHVLSQVASGSGVTLLPDYFRHQDYPGVAFTPVRDAGAGWDFVVLRQKGKLPSAAKALIDALKAAAGRRHGNP